MTNLEKNITETVSLLAQEMQFNVVDIKLLGKNLLVVQILLEKLNEDRITIEECASFSRKLAVILDVNETISSAYNLEISSAGIDRPLVRLVDFERFKNNDVVIKTNILIGNQKTFKAKLLGVNQELILIELNEKIIEIPFGVIDKANLDILKNYNFNGDINDKR
jgi:ribosome maturation factor RimP